MKTHEDLLLFYAIKIQIVPNPFDWLLSIKNNQIYLYGYDINKEVAVTFNFKRILSILSRRKSEKAEPKDIKVRFGLKDLGAESLDKNETIIDRTFDGYIIEGIYHNSFLAIQRMLSFGDKCVVLEPSEIKNNIIAKIKEMREIYG